LPPTAGRRSRELAQRISIFVNLPLTRLDRLALQAKLIEIGRVGHEEPVA